MVIQLEKKLNLAIKNEIGKTMLLQESKTKIRLDKIAGSYDIKI